jgi:hypothetical protein
MTVLLAAREWDHLWRNSVVEVFSDNTATVGIVNRGYSPCREYMRIAKKLFWLAVEGDFELRATWIPGFSNLLPDALSRFLTLPNSHLSGVGSLSEGLILQGSKARRNSPHIPDRTSCFPIVPHEVCSSPSSLQ